MKKCLECKKILKGANWELKIKKYCSRKCLGKANSARLKGNKYAAGHVPSKTAFNKESILGEKNYNWKGGIYSSKAGYRYKKAYEHPRAVRGYVAEHILVAEQQLGRLLNKGEEVHHINGNKSDNRPENLIALTKKQHLKEHPKERNINGQFT